MYVVRGHEPKNVPLWSFYTQHTVLHSRITAAAIRECSTVCGRIRHRWCFAPYFPKVDARVIPCPVFSHSTRMTRLLGKITSRIETKDSRKTIDLSRLTPLPLDSGLTWEQPHLKGNSETLSDPGQESRTLFASFLCPLAVVFHITAVLTINARYCCHQHKCEPLIVHISLQVNMRTVVDRDETPQ